MHAFPGNNGSPEFNSKKVLCIVEIGVHKAPPNDLIHAREDDMIEGSQGSQKLGIAFLVSHIPHLPFYVRASETLDSCCNSVCGR
jgi:hypothetical protein